VTPPPRVILVSDEQWERAGLRAELRDRGIDAVGVRDIPEALTQARTESGRGPVRALVIEQDALSDDVEAGMLPRVRKRLGTPQVVLLAHATREPTAGEWDVILRRPISIGEVADTVQRLVGTGQPSAPLDD
jgi:DNA-binding response OmpR family regulator